jgi:Cu-processing system permease protein
VMAAVWYTVLGVMSIVEPETFKNAWEAPATDPRMLIAVYLIFVQLTVVVALATFFSTFAGPMLSAVFTFALYVAGHFSADLKHFDAVVGASPVRYLTSALYYVLPNMALFDVKNAVVHAQPVPLGYIATATLYGLSFAFALLAASVWIFSRRDFK